MGLLTFLSCLKGSTFFCTTRVSTRPISSLRVHGRLCLPAICLTCSRRGALSAVVRVRSQVAGAGDPGGSSDVSGTFNSRRFVHAQSTTPVRRSVTTVLLCSLSTRIYESVPRTNAARAGRGVLRQCLTLWWSPEKMTKVDGSPWLIEVCSPTIKIVGQHRKRLSLQFVTPEKSLCDLADTCVSPSVLSLPNRNPNLPVVERRRPLSRQNLACGVTGRDT